MTSATNPSEARRVHRRWHRWCGASLAIAGCLVGCLYDPGNRCSANEVLANGRCECVAGAAMTETGCTLCGANEVPGDAGCVCADGFARPTASSACVSIAEGAACDTKTTPCSDATYKYCQIVSGTQGYCTTSGCAKSTDCTGGYVCDTTASPTYCKRPPTGLGQPCKSAADCASYEATYCETVQTHQCMVQGCTVKPNNCFEGYQCCDLTSLGLNKQLCVTTGNCPTAP